MPQPPVAPSKIETGICMSVPHTARFHDELVGMFLEQRAAQKSDHQRTLFYMARRRFFVEEVRLGQAQIVGDDAHHLTRVLRVEPGQRYEISDNHGVYLAEVQEARKSLVTFTIVEKIASEEALVRLTLFASLIRFGRFEWMIEKATELGVESIVPVEAGRSEKVWNTQPVSGWRDGNESRAKPASNRGACGCPISPTHCRSAKL